MNRFLGKTNKFLSLKIVFSILLVVCLAMGFQNFTNKYEFSDILYSIRSPWYLVVIFAMLFLNIFAESQKWRSLISCNLSSGRAVKAVLAGYSTAVVSPNRVGEFAGRNTLFLKEIRAELTTATFLGSFVQGSVTVCFGLVSLLVFPFSANLINHLDYNIFIWMLCALLFGFLGIYIFRNKLPTQFSAYISALKKVKLIQFYTATFWAILRYIIFLLQFYLALLLFGFEGSFLIAACGISLMYMVQSYIPLTSLGELGIREFLSFLIFSSYMQIGIAAVFPALAIWLVNIAIPSLAGLVVLKTRLSFAS